MKLKLIPFLLAGTALVSGCQQNANTISAPSIQKEDAIAVVNGQFISKADLETLTKEVSARARGQKIPTDKLVDEYWHFVDNQKRVLCLQVKKGLVLISCCLFL
jgi:peptidyl-prolyl cis-trans isomerase C